MHRVWGELVSGARVQVGFLPSYEDAVHEVRALKQRIESGDSWESGDNGITFYDLRQIVAMGVTKDDPMTQHPVSDAVQRWAYSIDYSQDEPYSVTHP